MFCLIICLFSFFAYQNLEKMSLKSRNKTSSLTSASTYPSTYSTFKEYILDILAFLSSNQAFDGKFKKNNYLTVGNYLNIPYIDDFKKYMFCTESEYLKLVIVRFLSVWKNNIWKFKLEQQFLEYNFM